MALPSRPASARAPLTLAQRSNFFPLTAWGYAWWRARSLSLLSGAPFSLEREARLFRALAAPQPGEWWLDAGTSAGFYAGVLAGAGCRVVALDLSPAMLRVAREREPSERITWRLGNVEALGVPEERFDGVTVGATLNETARPAVFLRALEAQLRPGGRLWLMYAAPPGGPVSRLLGRLGGLTFPDAAWVQAQLPGCVLVHATRFGAVQVMLLRREEGAEVG